jgi:hypothetical protein
VHEAKIFWFDRQFENSAVFARQSLTLDPTFTVPHLTLGAALVGLGDCAGALAEVSPPGVVDDSGQALAMQILVYQRCGLHAEPQAALDRLTAVGEAEAAPFLVAAGYASMGDNDRAQEWLERTLAERGFGVISLRSNPAFDRMRSTARFQQLLTSIRLN